MTFAVTITYSIRLGAQAAFMTALEAHLDSAVADETGCLRAEAYGDPARPGKVMQVQVFESSDAFDAYRASPLAKEFDSKVLDIVTTRSIATWSEIIERRRS